MVGWNGTDATVAFIHCWSVDFFLTCWEQIVCAQIATYTHRAKKKPLIVCQFFTMIIHKREVRIHFKPIGLFGIHYSTQTCTLTQWLEWKGVMFHVCGVLMRGLAIYMQPKECACSMALPWNTFHSNCGLKRYAAQISFHSPINNEFNFREGKFNIAVYAKHRCHLFTLVELASHSPTNRMMYDGWPFVCRWFPSRIHIKSRLHSGRSNSIPFLYDLYVCACCAVYTSFHIKHLLFAWNHQLCCG